MKIYIVKDEDEFRNFRLTTPLICNDINELIHVLGEKLTFQCEHSLRLFKFHYPNTEGLIVSLYDNSVYGI